MTEEYTRLNGEIELLTEETPDDDVAFLYSSIYFSSEFNMITEEEKIDLTRKFKDAVGERFSGLE